MKNQGTPFLLEVLAFIVVFMTEIQSALLAVGFLIMADSFTGIWGSWKRNGRKSITSRRAGRIVSKLILYPLALVVAKVSEDYLAPSIPWLDVTAGILATIEVKSIFENIGLILGFDLWDKIKKQLWKDKKEDQEGNKKIEQDVRD